MFGLGATEILVILVVVVFFFGAKKLPDVGRGLGKAIREFRKAEEEKDKVEKPPKPPDEHSSHEEKGGVIAKLPGLKEYQDVKKTINKVRKLTKPF